MFTRFTIHGVAVFRLSRKISDIASSGRRRARPSSSRLRSSVREGLSSLFIFFSAARARSPRAEIGRSLRSSRAAAVRTVSSRERAAPSAKCSSVSVWAGVQRSRGRAAKVSSSKNTTDDSMRPPGLQ